MKYIISILIPLIFISVLKPSEEAQNERHPAYILIEAETRTVIEEENSNVEFDIGYLSKLMSLLLIAEDLETGKYRTDTVLTAPESVRNAEGAVVWLEPGEKLTVDELLRSVIIGNANDAMLVLAEASERTAEDFVKRMNTRAFELGLRDTSFYDPCGYAGGKGRSTAHDTAIICAELARYSSLTPYFTIWLDTVREGGTQLVSENRLTRTYQNHIGFKECHSESSGYCIAEAGRNEKGETYIAVVLGAEDQDTAETKARRLIRTGFTDYRSVTVGFPEEFLLPLKVEHGTTKAVQLAVRGEKRVVISRGTAEVSTVAVFPEYICAPVRKGQKVGTVGYYSGRNLVTETDIVAAEDVAALDWLFIFRNSLTNLMKK